MVLAPSIVRTRIFWRGNKLIRSWAPSTSCLLLTFWRSNGTAHLAKCVHHIQRRALCTGVWVGQGDAQCVHSAYYWPCVTPVLPLPRAQVKPIGVNVAPTGINVVPTLISVGPKVSIAPPATTVSGR